jgi:Flp pilus assembly protein TadG
MSVMDRQPPTLRNVVADEHGAVLVEVSVVMTIMLVFLLGAIEFLFVFYQRKRGGQGGADWRPDRGRV